MLRSCWRVGPGVRAAASPGSGWKGRRKLPSAEKQIGEGMAKIESLGAMGERKVNLEAGKEKETCLCCKHIPSPTRESGSAPSFPDMECHPCLKTHPDSGSRPLGFPSP